QTSYIAGKSSSFIVTKRNYAPPEQSRPGAKLGPTVDIYALGAVLYRALAGHPPVDAEERRGGLADSALDPYVALSQSARVPVPARMLETIDRALSYRAGQRPQTVAEFAAGLEWGKEQVAPETDYEDAGGHLASSAPTAVSAGALLAPRPARRSGSTLVAGGLIGA